MLEGRRADTGRRRQRVLAALAEAAKGGSETSVAAIARRAGVDRTFLYRHRDLLGQIHAQAAEPPTVPGGRGPAVSRASLQTDLAAADARTARLVRFPRDAGMGDRGSDGSHERSPDDACPEKIPAGVA
ncbi:TetR/AcrR family transcriptional regulator (plasmid) [Streptomyces sp. NBC_00984]|nr:TetR/AcrR family transcriptional regulator [Streptomyces sp. NBC_00984]